MKYTAQFYDINDNLYSLEIGSGTEQQITLSATPITTEIESSDSHLYKPCKYSSATIGIVTDNYMFDLYSSVAQQNKVTLKDESDNVVWVGYVTPNLYSQGYETEIESIEVEAIDALSTLQYYKYETIGSSKGIVSFLQIINKLLNKCNAYSYFYVSDNIQYAPATDYSMIDKMYISEQNFFDEDGEAMDMQEVLENICQYLGLTAMADGDSVYFLDYDGIKGNVNTYYKFSVGGMTGTKVTLSQSKELSANDYSESGGTISLDNVYNKAVVKDSLYTFDSIIPSIWDDTYLTNYGGDWSYIEKVLEGSQAEFTNCFFKYLKNSNYKSYYYNKDTLAVASPTTINYEATQTYVGATICKAYFDKLDKMEDFYKDYNNFSLTDYLLLHVNNATYSQNRKLFELSVNNNNVSFISGSAYLVISGQAIYMDREGKMYIRDGYSESNDSFNSDDLYITCQLKYGNSYWNGSEWTTTESTFKLYFDNDGDTDHYIGRSLSVKNNITYDMGLEGEGTAIPMPNVNAATTGEPTFIIYQPHTPNSSYRIDAVWLSNFDIQAQIPNFLKDEDFDSDTEYSNVINEDYVNELESIDFNICTWDDKECNFSAVCYSEDNSHYYFVDKLYSKATGKQLRLEEHLIYKLVNQYSTPSTILELNLKSGIKPYATLTDSNNLSDKTFIVDSYSTDYRLGKQTIKLIEKK